MAAEREHRSIANVVAVLIMDYCERSGIVIPEKGSCCYEQRAASEI